MTEQIQIEEYISRDLQLPWIGVRTKHGLGVHGPPLWTGFMDHFHGPDPWSPVMDQVHGQFFNFYKKVLHHIHGHSKNKNSAKKRFDATLSTNAHDRSQIFSCAHITYTLLAHVQSQDC